MNTKIRENNKQCCTLSNGIYLDTLAQVEHHSCKKAYHTLKKRALAKKYTNEILYPLIDLKNEREQSYWNTYHCVRTLLQDTHGKVTSSYCKNRWCIVCNRIRTGILINTYSKPISDVDSCFLTLTSDWTKKCVTRADLEHTIDHYKIVFRKIHWRFKRKYGNLGVLRKLETTWNTEKRWFHPHFHVILENKNGSAEFFRTQWLKEFPKASNTTNTISVTDSNTVKEMFKYFTKLWKVNKHENLVLPYPPDVMDQMFDVLYRQRVIQSYGKWYGMASDDFNVEQANVFLNEQRTQPIVWNWEQELGTWVDYETGELRTY